MDLIEEAAPEGGYSVLWLFLRELRDWTWILLTETWDQIQRAMHRTLNIRLLDPDFLRGDKMFEFKQHQPLQLPDRRSEIAACVPPLLFGLGIALNALIYQGPWDKVPMWRLILSIAIGLIPMIVIGVGALLAIVRRLPDWGWTWLGSTFMGIVLFIKTLVEEMADEGRPLTPPAGETTLLIVFFIIVVILIGTAAIRGWRQAGLLSFGFSGTFVLSLSMAITAAPFNRTDLALLAAPIGLLISLLVYIFIRGSEPTRVAVILGTALLNFGVVLMANQVWATWIISRGSPSPLIPLLILSTILLLTGPIAGWVIRPLWRTFLRS
jgi:hypothetical protein